MPYTRAPTVTMTSSCPVRSKRRARSSRDSVTEVGKCRRRHDEDRHTEAVGRHDPLQTGLADVEAVLDVGQRHVHDQRIEKNHEQAKARGEECDALRSIHKPGPVSGTSELQTATPARQKSPCFP